MAVFPPSCLTWDPTMVAVMKIMATSFRRSHACTATCSGLDPAAGHWGPTPLLQTPGHSQASLGQPLVGLLLLSSGFGLTRFCLCPPREYFGNLMWRTDSFEKTLMLGKIEGRRRRGWQRVRWLDGLIDSMDMSLCRLWELVVDREAWRATVHWLAKNQTQLSNWTKLNWFAIILKYFLSSFLFLSFYCSILSFIYLCLGSPGGSVVKHLPASTGNMGSISSLKNPLAKDMAIPSIVLAWEIPWTEKSGRLQSMVLQESDTT